jgi:hypothetical protein
MAVNNPNQVAYGLSQSLINVFPFPIVSNRNPATSDKSQLGTVWVNKSTNAFYILTSIVANSASWVSVGNGTGIYASLEATTGNITADLGDIVATVGNVTAGAAISAGTTITAGTGLTVTAGGAAITGTTNINQAGAAATNISVTGTGAVSIGNTTGALALKGVTVAITGTTGINQSGALATNIGVTGTGAVSIGNTTGALALKGVTADLASAAVTINKNAGTNTTEIADGTTTGNYTIGSVNVVAGALVAKTLSINATAATDVTIGTGAGNTVGLGSATSGPVTVRSQNAAAGATLTFGTNGPQVMVGTGDPATVVTAPIGSFFMRTDAVSAVTRLYVNTDGITGWANVTCAA